MGKVHQKTVDELVLLQLIGGYMYLFYCTLADYTMNGIGNNQQGHQTTCNGGVGDNIWHCGGVMLTT